ncbi:hypothetical protein Tco_1205652 [Tanacetum coccineum]
MIGMFSRDLRLPACAGLDPPVKCFHVKFPPPRGLVIFAYLLDNGIARDNYDLILGLVSLGWPDPLSGLRAGPIRSEGTVGLAFPSVTNLITLQMLESALNSLLEGCHMPVADETTLQNEDYKVYERFWSQLSMPRMVVPGTTKKSLACSEQTASHSGDVKNLKELYMLSFKATDFTQLHGIYRLWVSEN